MQPGWFERKACQHGGRDTQFKAQLLSTTPEEASEICTIIGSVTHRQTAE